jgi:hypothetical protein
VSGCCAFGAVGYMIACVVCCRLLSVVCLSLLLAVSVVGCLVCFGALVSTIPRYALRLLYQAYVVLIEEEGSGLLYFTVHVDVFGCLFGEAGLSCPWPIMPSCHHATIAVHHSPLYSSVVHHDTPIMISPSRYTHHDTPQPAISQRCQSSPRPSCGRDKTARPIAQTAAHALCHWPRWRSTMAAVRDWP